MKIVDVTKEGLFQKERNVHGMKYVDSVDHYNVKIRKSGLIAKCDNFLPSTNDVDVTHNR